MCETLNSTLLLLEHLLRLFYNVPVVVVINVIVFEELWEDLLPPEPDFPEYRCSRLSYLGAPILGHKK